MITKSVFLMTTYAIKLIDEMKKHGSNTENISYAVLRLGTKQW